MRLLVGLCGFVLCVLFNCPPASAEASWVSAPSSWTKQKTYSSISQQPKNVDSTYNRDCQETKVITRSIVKGFSEQSSTQCVSSSAFGNVTPSCMLQRSGTRQYGPLYNASRQSICLLPAPNNSGAVLAKNLVGYGFYYDLYPIVDQHLTTFTSDTGTISHTLGANVWTIPIADKSGKKIPLIPDSIAFSDNGVWMVADSPTIGHVRVNMINGEVTPFGATITYSSAASPAWQTAISPSGRYAVMYSRDFNTFKMIDLDSCGIVPTIITGALTCSSKSMLAETQSAIPSLLAISRIRFKGEQHVTLTAISRPGGILKIDSGYMTASGTPLPTFDYLALGDSFASGEGAYEYKSVTADGQNNCHVSLKSYAFLIGKQLDHGGYNSVACSGSIMKDILSDITDYEGRSNTLLDLEKKENFERITSSFTPGVIPQHYLVEEHKPKAITLSISGNDIGFGGIIARCIMPDECYKSERSRIEKLNEIDAVSEELTNTYKKLQSAHPEIRIYAVGYPRVVNPDGQCAPNVLLDYNERKFANQLVDYLNNMIERTAKSSGVFYVDVSDALVGHQLCDNTFDIGMNGMTDNYDTSKDTRLWDYFKKPYATESYHPNKKGHELLAAAIITKTNNLTAPMPEPAYTAAKPIDRQLEILSHYTGTYSPIIDRTITENPAVDIVLRGQSRHLDIATKLAPGSRTDIILHSDPVNLGSQVTDQYGTLSLQLTIPHSVPAGFHTLRISGQTVAGEPVIIEKVVFVASSESDIDNDGILNEADNCVFAPNSGQDSDRDQQDDACDALITELVADDYIELPPNTPITLPIITNPDAEPAQDEPNPTNDSTIDAIPLAANTVPPTTTLTSNTREETVTNEETTITNSEVSPKPVSQAVLAATSRPSVATTQQPKPNMATWQIATLTIGFVAVVASVAYAARRTT